MSRSSLWLLLSALLVVGPASAARGASFVSGDCKLAFSESGSAAGEAVILLHGFAGAYEPWLRPLAGELASDFRVIGLDQRGHGQSCKPREAAAYGVHYARDVLKLMDHLGIDKAHVVGHSMGGIVSMYLAANHPDRLRSAVSIGNGVFTRGELWLIGWLMRGQYAWAALKRAFGRDDPMVVEGNDNDALMLAVRTLDDMTVTEAQARTLKVPVFAARGGPQDDPRNTVERLASINPSVQVLRIESADHMTMLANETFLDALREFLEAKR